MEIGQIVFSKSGRDKGKVFIIMAVEGEYAFLTDGKLRPLNKLKKKKAKHIQPTNIIVDIFDKTVSGGMALEDADIRKWLKAFMNKEEVSICQRTM